METAVKGSYGNLGGRWQIENNQWKVGNNYDWFRLLTALFHLFPHLMMMLFPISSSGYHSNIFDWLYFGSFIDHHDGTTCQFLFSINFRYTNILLNFPEGQKQEDSYCFQYNPRSRDLLPRLPPAQNCEKRERSSCPFHLSSWPWMALHPRLSWRCMTVWLSSEWLIYYGPIRQGCL